MGTAFFAYSKGAAVSQRPLVNQVLFRMNNSGRIYMRQVVFRFLRQVFRVPDPVARFAGAGCFIMPEVLVKRFDESNTLSQRNA